MKVEIIGGFFVTCTIIIQLEYIVSVLCQGNDTVCFVSFGLIFKGRSRVAPHTLDRRVKSLCVNKTGLLSHDFTLQCFHRSHKNCNVDICIWFQLKMEQTSEKSLFAPKIRPNLQIQQSIFSFFVPLLLIPSQILAVVSGETKWAGAGLAAMLWRSWGLTQRCRWTITGQRPACGGGSGLHCTKTELLPLGCPLDEPAMEAPDKHSHVLLIWRVWTLQQRFPPAPNFVLNLRGKVNVCTRSETADEDEYSFITINERDRRLSAVGNFTRGFIILLLMFPLLEERE